jgi:hypothetical protein
MVVPTPIDADLFGHARRAVTNCPTLALRLVPLVIRGPAR